MILAVSSLSQMKRDAISVKMATLLSILCLPIFAESAIPPIDDRCEITKAFSSFDENAFQLCDTELNECIDARMSRFAESEEQAQDQCWRLPLSMDPDFDGPCPAHMEELESRPITDRESLMQLVLVRNSFSSRNEFDAKIDVFKRNESLQSIRSLLKDDPDDPVALKLLHWTLLFTDDLVDQLDVRLKIQELDPDCPNSRGLFLWGVFRSTNVLVDNWLAGEGSGAELTTREIRDLLLRLQKTLIEAYDIAIQSSDHADKLRWARSSLHDAVLTRRFENFQLISRLVELGLDHYAENRRAALIRKFSNEYDASSVHGRSQSLMTICSIHALDLGLIDHCINLLNHFGMLDVNSLDTPAPDWTKAAISLMIGLTRDCSDYAELMLDGPNWWYERRCLAEQNPVLTSIIRELLGGFRKIDNSAEGEVLKAFLHLDETSDERFLRALALDSSMVIYASRLSKRLHKLGKAKTASDILANIDAEMASKLPRSEKELLDNTATGLKDKIYKNWIEWP